MRSKIFTASKKSLPSRSFSIPLCVQPRRISKFIIGSPAALLKATADLISGAARSIAFDELLDQGAYIQGAGSLVARDAEIDASALIGEGSLIASAARIENGARILSSVIGSGARIGPGAHLINTFVAPNYEIPGGFIAENQFFGYFAEK